MSKRSRGDDRAIRARRDGAMARGEFKYPTHPREPAAGATSFPLKAPDPDAERAIADFLAKRDAR